MRENRVKARMKQGKLAIGTYVSIAEPAIIEIIGYAGFDAAFIDMEHTSFDLNTIEEMIRACDLVDIVSLVRVPDNNAKTILRILEMGATGIQVPHIVNVDDAMEAVKAVRYAPLGERGVGGATRARRYGTVSLEEHMAASNSEILLAVMVEDRNALLQLEDIASLKGIDLIAVGPFDLAQSLGFLNDQRALRRTISDIAATLNRVGKARLSLPMGHAALPLTATDLQNMGVAYANCGPQDIQRLWSSFQKQVTEINQALGR